MEKPHIQKYNYPSNTHNHCNKLGYS